MSTEPQSIEVEVVEIDGAAPPARVEPRDEPQAQSRPQWQDWQQQWQGRVRTLDSRWWPLWVVLGAVAVVLLLTFGLVIAVAFLIFSIIRGFFRAIFR
ncbi:MAG: hypothetical protein EOP88_24590 [Verrucomicrobiaceae bacterium]|nr:MAG: hypothetical protein EOP88_24590 [Verrucomicrobiaceae bacterium]